MANVRPNFSVFLLICFLFLTHERKVTGSETTAVTTENTTTTKDDRKLDSSSGGLRGTVVTEVKLHSNGSAMSVGSKHWDDIVSNLLKQKNDNTTSTLNEELEEPVKPVLEKFSCLRCEEFNCDAAFVCYDAVQCFKARRRDSTGTETYFRGCVNKEDQIPFICAASYHNQVEGLAIECCQGSLCNKEEYPALPQPTGHVTNQSIGLTALTIYIVLGTLLCLVSLIIVIYLLVTRYFLKQKKFLKGLSHVSTLNPFSSIYRDGSKFGCIDDSVSRRMLNESVSSGSGSGLPLFVQRTLAKNIYLEDVIGKGRYGEVWKGSWHGETVAVKIFFTRDESSWTRETEVFSTALLRHDNILGFYGSDKTCRASCLQLWLIAHYHPNGSLFQYLQSHALHHHELFAICLSIVNGLLHLHTEITGTQGKPAIAHRDLNSNNVLVKTDGSCCISDFGLAVIRYPGTGEINVGSGDRSGTKRYMSPEILDGTMDMEVFESFRKADIYALSLVLWEACRRCYCNGIAEEYCRPFGNILPTEPTYEQMQRVVCAQKIRPPVPNRWKDDKVLTAMERILKECWHENPDVRLSTLRVKKNLLKLSSEELMDEVKGSRKSFEIDSV